MCLSEYPKKDNIHISDFCKIEESKENWTFQKTSANKLLKLVKNAAL